MQKDDVIYRKQVLDICNGAIDLWHGQLGEGTLVAVRDKISELPSAQPEPHYDEWCDDCKEYDKERHCCPRWNRVIRQALKDAQPEPQWIPCDERMPEEHEWIGTKKFGTTMSDEVYVTFENSKGERFTKHLHFHNGELSRYDKTHMDAWFKDYKPIAWMPLPEPYKKERKDGENYE